MLPPTVQEVVDPPRPDRDFTMRIPDAPIPSPQGPMSSGARETEVPHCSISNPSTVPPVPPTDIPSLVPLSSFSATLSNPAPPPPQSPHVSQWRLPS